jgi:hypothetical protein
MAHPAALAAAGAASSSGGGAERALTLMSLQLHPGWVLCFVLGAGLVLVSQCEGHPSLRAASP